MIKLVVFDWNGTLLSDAQACLEATNCTLKRLKKKPLSMADYRATLEMPVVNFYANHGFDKNYILRLAPELSKLFHEYYEERVKRCRSRTGALQILKWLNNKNVRVVILSNHTLPSIKFHVERLGLQPYIDEVLANEKRAMPMHMLNKVQKLRKYMKKNGYKKTQVAIVGDSPEDLETGKEVGVTTISIVYGHYAEYRLKALKPDALIGSLLELRKVLSV